MVSTVHAYQLYMDTCPMCYSGAEQVTLWIECLYAVVMQILVSALLNISLYTLECSYFDIKIFDVCDILISKTG